MRFVGLIIIFTSLPIFIALLKSNPEKRVWAYFIIGFMPFTAGWLNLDASIINYAGWPGHTKGLIITLMDSMALAILFNSAAPLRKLPIFGIFLFYIFSAILSIVVSYQPMMSGLYAFQLVRVIVVFIAVASIMRDPKAIHWLSYGMAAGAILQGAITIDQRLSGVVQASGTMGHQNLLGFMLHFVTLPLMALMLAGKMHKLYILGVLFALIAIALGASRGTVGFAAIGLTLLLGLSMLRQMTSHKVKILGLSVLAFAMVAPVVVGTFERRFKDSPIELGRDSERVAFERAAKSMWSDHPMGVGANQYVIVSNTQGYAQRAGVIWNYGSRSAHVHQLYLLAAAETGWLGMFSLIGLFGWTILRGFTFAFGNRRDPRGDVILGASIAVLVAAFHSFYEWIFVAAPVQYVFAISLGIIAGTIRQVKLEKRLNARMSARRANNMNEITSDSPIVRAS